MAHRQSGLSPNHLLWALLRSCRPHRSLVVFYIIIFIISSFLDGNNGRHAYFDGVHPPTACFDGMRNTCRCGVGAGGFRALVGWTARDAGMGARTDERVPDCVRKKFRRHAGATARSSAGLTKAWIKPVCSVWTTWYLLGLNIFARTCE